MSGIGDQGMMPAHVQPQRADDDTVDERVTQAPEVRDPLAEDEDEDSEQSEVDAALAGISDDERADAERAARLARDRAHGDAGEGGTVDGDAQAAEADDGDTRSQRNP